MKRSWIAIASVAGLAASGAATVALMSTADAGTAQVEQHGYTTCTTDSAGKCTVAHALGVKPKSVLVTPDITDGAAGWWPSTVLGSWTTTTFTVKARTATNTAAASRVIHFSWDAYADAVAPPPSTTPTPTTTTTPPTSSTTTPPPSSTTTTTPTGGLALDRIDSGADGKWQFDPATYYARFPAAGKLANPSTFPVAVWYEAVTQQSDIDLDKAAGLTGYVMLTQSTDMGLIGRNGMWAMPSPDKTGVGSESVGWMLADEVDLWGHEGSAPWTGNYPGQGPICQPESALCGYTILDTENSRTPQGDGRMRFQNMGFGVDTYIGDAPSATFLNRTDASSIDRYWYTDDGICTNAGSNVPASQCHVAASYGASVDRMRQLAKLSATQDGGPVQPTLGFVEDGCPFSQFSTCITGPQIQGAVMSELIHEARGIIYFNHNFGGSCQSQHVLRDSCGAAVRPYVTDINQHIADLAPVLNTQSYAWTFNPSIDSMLKRGPDGSYYLFTMTKRGADTGYYELNLPDGLTNAGVQVLYENRSIAPVNGRLGDTWAAENSWHIYKITP